MKPMIFAPDYIDDHSMKIYQNHFRSLGHDPKSVVYFVKDYDRIPGLGVFLVGTQRSSMALKYFKPISFEGKTMEDYL